MNWLVAQSFFTHRGCGSQMFSGFVAFYIIFTGVIRKYATTNINRLAWYSGSLSLRCGTVLVLLARFAYTVDVIVAVYF
eukprot:TRINITY_DN2621_c0_g1_i2.p1 TRINITY_DN2621_c0_g1~~TRINITY_DN2621_c0_g1_i2.p1  ORF type:complete len:79 (-),score=6.06 TRINITY_DN2621_c0_g1_i2:43-279(-)